MGGGEDQAPKKKLSTSVFLFARGYEIFLLRFLQKGCIRLFCLCCLQGCPWSKCYRHRFASKPTCFPCNEYNPSAKSAANKKTDVENTGFFSPIKHYFCSCPAQCVERREASFASSWSHAPRLLHRTAARCCDRNRTYTETDTGGAGFLYPHQKVMKVVWDRASGQTRLPTVRLRNAGGSLGEAGREFV